MALNVSSLAKALSVLDGAINEPECEGDNRASHDARS
jgi:hypothetical protein